MKREIRYEPIEAKTLLNAVKAPSMPFDWSINPYRGCQHGCSFCYARSTHAFLGIEADDTFQNHILLKENAADALREQLRKMSRTKGIDRIGQVAIGTATDPYQQVEAKAELTRRCLEVLLEYPVPVSITTRSPLILRDIDLLRQLPVTSVNISMSTLDRTVWKRFEPSTPSPAKRLEALKALNDAGIPAGVFMAPILPYITDREHELEPLIAAISQTGARFVMSSFLRLSTREVKVWFFRTLEQHYPQLVTRYGELYAESAYAPKSYAEPMKQTIRRLLEQYGLPPIEPYRGRPQVDTKEPGQASNEHEAPVQLSFSF